MSRVFWDAVLFIYLLEDHPEFAPRVKELLDRSYSREDVLLTSHVALGEVMAAGKGDLSNAKAARETLVEMGFSFLSFEDDCVALFGSLRSVVNLKAPDSIHLACSASTGVELLLTRDNRLLNRRLHMPGIQIIADFRLPIL